MAYDTTEAVAKFLSGFQMKITNRERDTVAPDYYVKYSLTLSKGGKDFSTTFVSDPRASGEPTVTQVFSALADDALTYGMRCPQEWSYRPKAGGRRIPRATEGAGSVPFGAFLCRSISGRPAEHGSQYHSRYDRGGYGLQYPRQRRMQRAANGLFYQDRPHEHHIREE